MTQWFLKISDFSEDLLASLDTLERWPEKVRLMQKNWIGRSEGLLMRFELAAAPVEAEEIEVYTTRPDTLFGAKFIALAPDHPLAEIAAQQDPDLAAFIEDCRHRSTSAAAIETMEKRGYDTGLKARHPFDEDWLLPVYVANFVLMDYGTGAIFGCPAHDQRDLDFANEYGLGATPVVCPPDVDPATFAITDTAYDGDGVLINSRFLDGLTIDAAKEEVARRLEATAHRRQAAGQAPGEFPAARLGHFAAALLGLPDPDHPLRSLRRGAGARGRSAGDAARRRLLRRARQSARPAPDLQICRLSALRRPGAARDGHDGHVRRFPPGIFCASPTRGIPMRRRRPRR